MNYDNCRSLPKFAGLILCKIVSSTIEYSAIGDFSERYNNIRNEKGKLTALIWCWVQIIQILPGFINVSLDNSGSLLISYVVVSYRNMNRNKIYSSINISGLAIGLTCFILIFLYIRYETNYDRFHVNAEKIFRVVIDFEPVGGSKTISTYPALARSLKEDFSQITKSTKIKKETCVITYNKSGFNENNVYYVEQDFLDMFTYPLLSGDSESALLEPNSVLFTREMAEKYFSGEDPTGKIVEISTWPYTRKFSYKITGVMKDIPENSHLNFDFLVSYSSYYSVYRNGKAHVEDSWNYFDPNAYIMLDPGTDPGIIEQRFSTFLEKYKSRESVIDKKLVLQPVLDINIQGNIGSEESNNSLANIYLFSTISILIILIASFNYMNLSTASSTKRFKEIGIRKIVGAKRVQLFRQFLGESIIFSFFAFGISLILVKVFLLFFNRLLDKEISLDISVLAPIILYLVGITLLISLISGIYPALLLSSFRPVNIIKGSGGTYRGSFNLKNLLVVFQFIISIALIICTFIIRDQLIFLKHKNLGYSREQIITLHSMDSNLNRNYEPFFNELVEHYSINGTAAGLDIPTTIRRRAGIKRGDKPDEQSLGTYYTYVSHNYLELYEVEFQKGRNFPIELSTDMENSIIINETTAKRLGLKDPVGKEVIFDRKDYTVIGVVKDFNFRPLFEEIRPLVIIPHYKNSIVEYFSIKIDTDDISGTISYIKDKWHEFSPEYPFEYSFLDEKIDAAYKSEQRMGKSFDYLTIIATFIACTGLLGLASFSVEQKKKEIGIRKVLGSSIAGVIDLIAREFLVLVFVSNVIAWPLAWLFADNWLQQFAYQTDLSFSLFILSGSVVLILALLTVSYQSIKAALLNPIDSINYE